MRIPKRLNRKGFTLIELMIVMSIVGILAAIAAPNYQWGLIKAKESVLAENLYSIRTTIDQFAADQGKYPDSLDELVSKRYLREIPKDPFTGAADWETRAATAPTDGSPPVTGIGDVKSRSNIIGRNGKPYFDW